MKQHITLLGSQPLPLYYAIKEYNPEIIHLICTEENKTIAERIKQLIATKVKCETYQVSAYNPIEVINICEKIHQTHPDDDYLYNLTGGTKIMSFAAYSVAMKHESKLIYTSQSNEIIDMRSFNSAPIQCHLTNEEIFAIQGQELDSYELLNKTDSEKIKNALKIKNFIESDPHIYSKLGLLFRQNYSGNCSNLPEHFFIKNSVAFIKTKDGFQIEKDNYVIFEIEHPDALMLLLEGRWWETLMADALLKWCNFYNKSFTIWQNVKFHSSDGNKTKNEIDILINIGTKFLFIECKSGSVQQTDVYKIDAVRSTYGGDMSKAVLASYRPLNESIKEKCQNQDISFFAPQNPIAQKKHLNTANLFFSNIVNQLNI